MNLHKRSEPSAPSAEIQEDVSRDAVASAFENAMSSHFRSHVSGTNINDRTFLASDYLNQFHELVMLLQAISMDPASFKCDLASWHAVDYEEHFNRSKLQDRELAIAAYRRAPEYVRRKFDDAIASLQAESLRLVADVARALDQEQDLKMVCDRASSRLRVLIDDASAIANGHLSGATGSKGTMANRVTIDTLFRLREA